jgi:hypothetical protein
MEPIRFGVELFLTGESYMRVGGYAGKAVPLDYTSGLVDLILAHLEARYPAYDWAMERDKWETAIIGYPKEAPDPTPAVIEEVRLRVLGGRASVTLEEAAKFNAKE